MNFGQENVWLIVAGGFSGFLSNTFYMFGGTAGFGLWWRRILAVLVIASAANLLATVLHVWVWKYLLFYPCLAVGMSLGYGAKTTLEKVLKRTLFALGVIACCFVGAWITHFSTSALIILGLAVATGLTSVVLGVLNPFNNAPLEQYIICQLLLMYVPWWAFVR